MNRRRRPFRIAFLRPFIAACVVWTLVAWPGAPVVRAGETPTTTATSTADAEIVESKADYQSQGKTIAVERFEPKAPGRYPAVLVLHGSAGLRIGGKAFRESARRLAGRGYVAHVVHYFDLTGTELADLTTMKANFPAWLKAVFDGVTNASKQPNVDPNRVGLLGYSLGSYLALAEAMFDQRVSAVVEYFGGLPEVLLKEVKSLPPTLILHGDSDLIVPVSEARVLETLCKAKNVPHEVRIYTRQGHGFTGEAGEDAARRALAFFETHLKQAPRRHEVARPNFDAYLPAAKPGAPAPVGGGKN